LGNVIFFFYICVFWIPIFRGGDCARLKRGECGDGRFAIPGANVLANVAANYVIADPGTQIFGNRGTKFDGEIRNAAARIQDVRLSEGLGRAGVETESAGTTAVGGGRFIARERGRQIESGDDDAEEKPRTNLLIDEAGIFCQPAQAGIFGGDTFDDGASVGVGAGGERFRPLSVHCGDEGVEFLPENFVIVVAPGVTGNPTARGIPFIL
jgi:hypothetical protein